MYKYFVYFGLLIFVSGCFQSSASLIGPSYTLATTGNVYQASLSYGVNQALQKTTGKNSKEHVKVILEKTEIHQKKIKTYKAKIKQEIKDIKAEHEAFLTAVKANIEKSKENLLN